MSSSHELLGLILTLPLQQASGLGGLANGMEELEKTLFVQNLFVRSGSD